MTITISIDELRAHEAALKRYFVEALSAAGEITIKKPGHYEQGLTERGGEIGVKMGISANILEKYAQDHPMPKLIPVV